MNEFELPEAMVKYFADRLVRASKHSPGHAGQKYRARARRRGTWGKVCRRRALARQRLALTSQTRVANATTHVVMYSGGIGSYCAAKRVVEARGPDEKVILLFADTLIEAPDLYTFMRAGAKRLRVPLIELRDGRDIWQVFKDVRYLGNTRVDPCSYHLKRKLMRDWIDKHCDPTKTIIYLGIDWSEDHRLVKARPYWEPFTVAAPMIDPPYVDKEQMIELAEADGLEIPSLYRDGFPHNNRGGGCVKAGMGHFKLLLEKRPAVYAEWERREEEIREYLGKDVAILRDRRGGTTRPLTLREYRLRITAGEATDEYEFGGCACAVGDIEADQAVVELGMPGRRPADEAA